MNTLSIKHTTLSVTEKAGAFVTFNSTSIETQCKPVRVETIFGHTIYMTEDKDIYDYKNIEEKAFRVNHTPHTVDNMVMVGDTVVYLTDSSHVYTYCPYKNTEQTLHLKDIKCIAIYKETLVALGTDNTLHFFVDREDRFESVQVQASGITLERVYDTSVESYHMYLLADDWRVYKIDVQDRDVAASSEPILFMREGCENIVDIKSIREVVAILSRGGGVVVYDFGMNSVNKLDGVCVSMGCVRTYIVFQMDGGNNIKVLYESKYKDIVYENGEDIGITFRIHDMDIYYK